MKPFVVFLSGINDAGTVQVNRVRPDGSLQYNLTGALHLHQHLESDAFDWQAIVLDTLPNAEFKVARPPDLIFNEIAEPDSHVITLNKVQQLVSRFGQDFVFLNKPEHVLKTTRDEVFRRLNGIKNLIVPLTLRFRPRSPADILAQIRQAGLTFPVIMRPCGAHTGRNTQLLNSADEALNLYSLPLDGSEYYLTQYHDYSENGIFRKFRIILVDGTAYLRHMRFSDNWIIHRESCAGFMEANPRYIEAEIAMLNNFETELRPQIQAILDRICQRIGLDYFGIDCAIGQDGQVLIFEVNACMTVLNSANKSAYYEEPLAKLRAGIVRMILARSARPGSRAG